MKQLLTLALALVVMATFSGLATAAAIVKSSKSNVSERVAADDPIAAACQGKKLGDTVKVGGKDLKCEQRHIAVSDSAPQPPPPPVIKIIKK